MQYEVDRPEAGPHLLLEGRALRHGDVQQHAGVAHGHGPRHAAGLAGHDAHAGAARLLYCGNLLRLVVLVPAQVAVRGCLFRPG